LGFDGLSGAIQCSAHSGNPPGRLTISFSSFTPETQQIHINHRKKMCKPGKAAVSKESATTGKVKTQCEFKSRPCYREVSLCYTGNENMLEKKGGCYNE